MNGEITIPMDSNVSGHGEFQHAWSLLPQDAVFPQVKVKDIKIHVETNQLIMDAEKRDSYRGLTMQHMKKFGLHRFTHRSGEEVLSAKHLNGRHAVVSERNAWSLQAPSSIPVRTCNKLSKPPAASASSQTAHGAMLTLLAPFLSACSACATCTRLECWRSSRTGVTASCRQFPW